MYNIDEGLVPATGSDYFLQPKKPNNKRPNIFRQELWGW